MLIPGGVLTFQYILKLLQVETYNGFGAGSNPSSSSGAYQKVEYNSIGSKTFTLVNNGIAYTYTNFINILYNGTNGHPEISSTDSLLCLNDIGNYSTSTLADNYIWQVIRPDSINLERRLYC